MTAAGEDLEFDYENFWYIKIRGEGDKRPKEKCGGYFQDFEAADCVYSHEEVLESDEPNWAIVGIRDGTHTRRSILTFDLDIHKAPNDFELDDYNALPGHFSKPVHAQVITPNSDGYLSSYLPTGCSWRCLA